TRPHRSTTHPRPRQRPARSSDRPNSGNGPAAGRAVLEVAGCADLVAPLSFLPRQRVSREEPLRLSSWPVLDTGTLIRLVEPRDTRPLLLLISQQVIGAGPA